MKYLTFSYDDGVFQDRRLVEILNRYGMKATFNLNTGIQSTESRFEVDGVPVSRMEQENLAALYQGHEIAVHGLTHTALTGLSAEALAQELLTDAKNIERLYGRYPLGMAYPYGVYDDAVVSYLESIGIRYARTVGSTHGFSFPSDPMRLEATCHHEDEQLFELARQFLEADTEEPMLFYIWGHSYEFEVHQNWERIERLCEMLAGREDIFYGTNAECLRLV